MGQQEQQEEIRKGPWTEQEDILLVNFVHLFGDRRWDFIAKVSGLNRTGKSCRLRWVNYLHPGLKRGKMSPQEEKLVLQLHAKWGNRWSRIARKLPGRTDNEIKNYWRTHMRKKAQEKKRALMMASPSSSSSICSSSSSSNLTSSIDSLPYSSATTAKPSFYDTGGIDDILPNLTENSKKNDENGKEHENGFYSMDDIWKDIDLSEQNKTMKQNYDGYYEEGKNISFTSMSMASPTWDYSWETIWKNLGEVDEQNNKKNIVINNVPNDDQFFSWKTPSFTG